jgi:hypothetical protein
VSGRLGWPFAELSPSRLAAPEAFARALSRLICVTSSFAPNSNPPCELRSALVGLRASFNVIVIDESDRAFVHVHVLGRIHVGAAIRRSHSPPTSDFILLKAGLSGSGFMFGSLAAKVRMTSLLEHHRKHGRHARGHDRLAGGSHQRIGSVILALIPLGDNKIQPDRGC